MQFSVCLYMLSAYSELRIVSWIGQHERISVRGWEDFSIKLRYHTNAKWLDLHPLETSTILHACAHSTVTEYLCILAVYFKNTLPYEKYRTKESKK